MSAGEKHLGFGMLVLGLLAFALLYLTIERSPLISFDDIVLASASRAFVSGGDGTPAVYPPESTTFPFPVIFGPVFFWLQGQAFENLGVSPFTGRIVPLVATFGLAGAGAALTWLMGRSWVWAATAFGFVMLAPEVGRSATIGRMDTLAVALEIIGLALFVAGIGAGRATGTLAGAVAGCVWALAALTTPRVFPFFIGAATGIAVTIPRAAPRARSVTVLQALAAAALFGSGIVFWSWHLGVTPVIWAMSTFKGMLTDPGVVTSPAAWRDWADAVFLTGAFAVVPAVLMVWRPAIRQGDPSTVLVLTTATCNAVVLVIAGGVNWVPIYFGLPLQIAALAAAARLAADRRLPRVLAAWGALVLVAFAGYRAIRHLDTFQAWEARSPAGLERIVRDHVPRGSVVLGYEEFYYYAVEQAGARFVMMNNEEFNFATWQRAWPATPQAATSRGPNPRPQYFLWPDTPAIPVPAAFQCATRYPLARYFPRSSRRSILDPSPGATEWSVRRTYPDTVLYTIAPDCDPLGNLQTRHR